MANRAAINPAPLNVRLPSATNKMFEILLSYSLKSLSRVISVVLLQFTIFSACLLYAFTVFCQALPHLSVLYHTSLCFAMHLWDLPCFHLCVHLNIFHCVRVHYKNRNNTGFSLTVNNFCYIRMVMFPNILFWVLNCWERKPAASSVLIKGLR